MSEPVPEVVSVTTPPAPTGGQHAAQDAVWTPPEQPPAPTPAPPVRAATGSPLLALRDRRKALQDKLFIDLQVPRWGEDGGPRVYVRYGPANTSWYADEAQKIQKMSRKPTDWMTKLNANLLVRACVGVFAVEGEDPLSPEDTRTKFSLRDGDPTGEWTKFDTDLAYSLGLDEGTASAIAVCRELFFTDADLATAAQQVLKFSGIRTEEDQQGFFDS